MLLLTQRASYKGTHSSQICFVGGKLIHNETYLEAALRESVEEVCLDEKKVKVLRELSPIYIPPSNFFVRPFLAYTETRPIFKPNYEVNEIIEVSAKSLFNSLVSRREIETMSMNLKEVPCFVFDDKVIWGATAMILSELKDLVLKCC